MIANSAPVFDVSECRCDCANCAAGDHLGCYYWPQPICCPLFEIPVLQ